MGKDVIIACDFNSKAEVIAFLEKFNSRCSVFSDPYLAPQPGCQD